MMAFPHCLHLSGEPFCQEGFVVVDTVRTRVDEQMPNMGSIASPPSLGSPPASAAHHVLGATHPSSGAGMGLFEVVQECSTVGCQLFVYFF